MSYNKILYVWVSEQKARKALVEKLPVLCDWQHLVTSIACDKKEKKKKINKRISGQQICDHKGNGSLDALMIYFTWKLEDIRWSYGSSKVWTIFCVEILLSLNHIYSNKDEW